MSTDDESIGSHRCPPRSQSWAERSRLQSLSYAKVIYGQGNDSYDGGDSSTIPSTIEGTDEQRIDDQRLVSKDAMIYSGHRRIMNLIERLLARLLDCPVKHGKLVDVTEMELTSVATTAGELFLEEQSCLTIRVNPNDPLLIIGDLHGQYRDMISLFEKFGFPPKQRYLFLGNYISHGKQSLEILLLLFCYKIQYPKSVYLLRGNHENKTITRVYKFFDETKKRLNARAHRVLIGVFELMPLAAIIENCVFCCHSGISPELMADRLTDVKKLVKHMTEKIVQPVDGLSDGLATDLMWAEPDYEVHRWAMNESGCSYLFSPEILREFMEKFKFDLIVRSNRMVNDGYEFFDDRRLLTIFSAPHFAQEFLNNGAALELTRSKHMNQLESRIIIMKFEHSMKRKSHKRLHVFRQM